VPPLTLDFAIRTRHLAPCAPPPIGPTGYTAGLDYEDRTMAGHPKRSYTVAALRGAARAPGTLEAYRRDWQRFVTWCAGQSCAALPAQPDTVAAFLADQAGRLKPASLERCLAAIRFHHRQAGLRLDADDPVVTDVRRGIQRTLGTDQIRKAPLSVEDLRLISAALPGSLAGLRDKALILVGFAGAFRRSELAGIRVEQLRFSAAGLTVYLPRSKDDPKGQGREVGIPRGRHLVTCPVKALQLWLVAAKLGDGPVFRAVDRHGNLGDAPLSGNSVSRIVKRAVAAAGRRAGWTRAEIADRVAATAGHSLRAGLVSAAAAAGAPEHQIQRQTRHAKIETTRRYIRVARLFQDHVVDRIGL